MKIAIESQRIFRGRKHGMDIVAVELIRQIQQVDKSKDYILFAKKGADNSIISETSNFRIQLLEGITYGDWEQIALPRALKKHKPRLIHCTANTAPVACPVPLILTLHDIIFLRETTFGGTAYQNFGNIYRKLVVPLVIKKAEIIITVSHHEKSIISTHCDVNPDKIKVIYNAVHERFRQPFSEDELYRFRDRLKLPDAFVLHLGNTAPKKNTMRMIEGYVTYAQHSTNPISLVIADYPQSLVKSKLAQMNCAHLIDRIHFTGYVPTESMPLLYNCATLFVYPSLTESFGLPVLEAMACGKPVITSSIPALQEVAGDAAIFVDPENSRAIAEAISAILSDRQDYKRLNDLGLKRSRDFSWRKSAEELVSIYNGFA